MPIIYHQIHQENALHPLGDIYDAGMKAERTGSSFHQIKSQKHLYDQSILK